MHRIDTPNARADMFGPGKNGYHHNDDIPGMDATYMDPDALNAGQEEIAGVIEATGVDLSKGDNTQLRVAIAYMIQQAMDQIKPVAKLEYFASDVAPAGYVITRGLSIGNADSNATERANADCERLFKHLWAKFPGLVVQSSAGVVVARGSTAAADWAANKRLVLWDERGESRRGADLGRGITGLDVGAHQMDAYQEHDHASAVSGFTHVISAANAGGTYNAGTVGGPRTEAMGTGSGRAANETRVRGHGWLPCISL